ncbi:hypothetical protein PG987_011454 [Apiospora arundinis]
MPDRGGHTVRLRNPDTEGRLSYDDEDLFMQNTQAMAFEADGSNHSNMPEYTSQEDVTMASPGTPSSFNQEANMSAAVQAFDFLRLFSTQLEEYDDIEEVCGPETNSMLDEVVDTVQTCDPTFAVHSDGNQYRLLTNPPYSETVINLFPQRTVLIVNPCLPRATAADMTEYLDRKGSNTKAR